MSEDIDQLLAKMATDFDEFAREIERKIEILAADKPGGATIKRLEQILVIARRGAVIARSKRPPE